MLTDQNYNPDVLSCIANLSSDEVFTPPELVNQMLDLLPQELFRDKSTTFLDPACKSGVFLREIAKRLDIGLEAQIPDRQKRIDHIFTKQLYGLAITELTSLLSRRSLYCSKHANGKYSVCTKFKNEKGNIHYSRIEHTWETGRCKYCGANEQGYDRGEELESHAYSFIHTENPEELFKMKFDVIIGNPPYQLSSNEYGIQAVPLYDRFVLQAKRLRPRYLVMIIPGRWYNGGMGMTSFRESMLNDKKIRVLIDHPKSRDCFPGVDIAGGVCYFLWDREYIGNCEVTTRIGDLTNTRSRRLDEFDVFIRDNIGIDVVHKVMKKCTKMLSERVHSISPFGFPTSKRGNPNAFTNCIRLISSTGISYIPKDEVQKNREIIDRYKVSIGQLNPDRGGVNNAMDGKMNVITKVKIYEPNEVFTATYLLLDHFATHDDALEFSTYISSKFVRFLISLTLSSMHITKDSFRFVPVLQSKSHISDEALYKFYELTQEEVDYIESMIRPMELADA